MVGAITGAADSASSDFISVLTTVAPLAVGIVVGVIGVRLVIKLFNRGAGK